MSRLLTSLWNFIQDDFAEISDFHATRKRSKLKRGLDGSKSHWNFALNCFQKLYEEDWLKGNIYLILTGSQKQPVEGLSRASSSFAIDKKLSTRNGKLTLEKSNVGSYHNNRKEALDVRRGKVIYSNTNMFGVFSSQKKMKIKNMFGVFKFIIHYQLY